MKRWTEQEINFLKDNYSKHGCMFCAKYLNRTTEAINIKANKLKIKRDGNSRYNRKNTPNGYIYCGSCDQVLEEGKFYKKNKMGQYGKKTQKCRSCIQRTARRYYRHNKSSALNKLHSNPEKTIFNRVKARAKQNNIEFNLTIDDIVIPKKCPVLDIDIIPFDNSVHSPSVDRLDPNKGYIKGNIKIISKKANAIKQNATSDELYKVYKYTKKYWL